MSNLIPIQITLQAANAADARQLIQDLAGTMQIPPQTHVSTVPASAASPQDQLDTPATSPASKAAPQEPEVEPINNDEPETDNSDASDEPIPTDVELRVLAAEIGKKGPEAKKKIKELLGKYGVPNITAVPNAKRVAFKRDLGALA